MAAYALVFVEPALAVMLGWLVAMPSRQIGHFFFEPRDYDVANQATHEYKEAVKVGYNLRRKVVRQVSVLGIFSDWPAPVTYYANCMGGR